MHFINPLFVFFHGSQNINYLKNHVYFFGGDHFPQKEEFNMCAAVIFLQETCIQQNIVNFEHMLSVMNWLHLFGHNRGTVFPCSLFCHSSQVMNYELCYFIRIVRIREDVFLGDLPWNISLIMSHRTIVEAELREEAKTF